MHVYFIFFPKKKHLTNHPPSSSQSLFPIFFCFSLAGTASSIILPEQPAAREPVHPHVSRCCRDHAQLLRLQLQQQLQQELQCERLLLVLLPLPSLPGPFLLLPLPLPPRLPGASRIHTYPKNQTNKETKSPESSSTGVLLFLAILLSGCVHRCM